MLLLAEQEVALVEAVDGPVLRYLHTGDRGQGGEHVVDRKHLVALAGGDVARPLDHARGSDRALSPVAHFAGIKPVGAASVGARACLSATLRCRRYR